LSLIRLENDLLGFHVVEQIISDWSLTHGHNHVCHEAENKSQFPAAPTQTVDLLEQMLLLLQLLQSLWEYA